MQPVRVLRVLRGAVLWVLLVLLALYVIFVQFVANVGGSAEPIQRPSGPAPARGPSGGAHTDVEGLIWEVAPQADGGSPG